MNFLNECYGLDINRFELHRLQKTLLCRFMWEILNKQCQVFFCAFHFFFALSVDPDQVKNTCIIGQQQNVENYCLKNHQDLN